MTSRLLPELGLFGIVRVYNPNSWITIPMTRIVGKIYENTKENKENKGAASGSAPPGRCRAPEVVFFDFLSIFVYFANNPSHWDGNPGIGIVNPNNPSSGRGLTLPFAKVGSGAKLAFLYGAVFG